MEILLGCGVKGFVQKPDDPCRVGKNCRSPLLLRAQGRGQRVFLGFALALLFLFLALPDAAARDPA